MIELIKVGKYFPTSTGRNYLFRDVSLVLPINKNVGVIGPNGAGKSTFLRMLAGAELPSEGRIIRSGKISWSLGMSPGLQNTMTGAENTRFAARVYGMRSDEIKATIEKVRQLADVGKYFDMPLHTYSAGMRQKISFAMSMSMDFEYYLFDEISAGGDVRFRERTEKMIKERLAKANFILVTHSHSEIVELCQACILIGGGKLTYFDDALEAIEKYNELFGSEETQRKAEQLAKKAARLAAKQSGADPRDASATEGRRRVDPLPMAPRRPRDGAALAAEGDSDTGANPPSGREEKAARVALKREEAAQKKQLAAERRRLAEEKAKQRAEVKAAAAARKEAAADKRQQPRVASEEKAQLRAERLAAIDAKKAAGAVRKEAKKQQGSTAAAERKTQIRAEKQAAIAARKATAAERRKSVSLQAEQNGVPPEAPGNDQDAADVPVTASKVGAERKAQMRAEKQAAIAAKKAAAAERRKSRHLQVEQDGELPETPASDDGAGDMPITDAATAAGRGPSKRRGLLAHQRRSGQRAGRRNQPIARLRNSIAALKTQLTETSGEDAPNEIERIRRELAAARQELKGLAASRRSQVETPDEAAGDLARIANETATTFQEQSDE